MAETTFVDAATIRRLAALSGLILTPEQAAAHVATLQEVLTVDAAIAALNLGNLPATGYPWEARTDAPDRRG
jgi:hypothetical protein